MNDDARTLLEYLRNGSRLRQEYLRLAPTSAQEWPDRQNEMRTRAALADAGWWGIEVHTGLLYGWAPDGIARAARCAAHAAFQAIPGLRNNEHDCWS